MNFDNNSNLGYLIYHARITHQWHRIWYYYPLLREGKIAANVLIAFLAHFILTIAFVGSVATAQSTTRANQEFRPRIIGGVDVQTPTPYVAMLVYQGLNSRYYGCAGTLIAPDKVLTAGHCVDDRVPVEVVLGRSRISDSQEGEVHTVASLTIHPRFSVRTLENDIAIITLDKPSTIPPILLATRSMLESLTYDSELTVQGWGYTNPSFLNPSDVLREAVVRYIPRYVCNSSMFYDKLVGPGMICAGFIEGGADSCGGDSGGPLTLKVQQTQYLLGSVSWGASDSCGQAHKPGVYTDLTYYQAWIHQEIYERTALPIILRRTPKRSATVGIGDLDGDGVKELVSVHGNQLKISSGGTTSKSIIKLRKPKRYRTTNKFDIVDVNGDHRDDIVITSGNHMQIYSLKNAGALWSPSNFSFRRAFATRKILLPGTTPIIDSKWGRILSPDKAQLAILTTRNVIVLSIDFTKATVEFTTNSNGGKSLLVGSIDDAPLDSVFVFDGSTFKNVFLADATGVAISSGQTAIDAPQETFFYDMDGDGINELLSITPSGKRTSLVSVARFDGISFGKFSPWFEVPRGSVLAL